MSGALQGSDLLTDLFMQSPQIVGICRGPEHVIEFVNPAFERLTDYRVVLGKPVRKAFPELVELGLIENLDKVFATGETYVGQQRRIHFLQRDAQRSPDIYFDFVFQPVRGADGSIIGVFGHGHDVTDEVKAQGRADALQALLVRNSKLSGMDSMGAMLAHELNQPLTVIVNLLRAVRNFLDRPTPENLSMARDTMGDIEEAALRAGELIRRLRDTVSRGHIRNSPENLSEIVREALDLTATARVQHGIACRVDVARDIIIQGDRIQLQQVFLNLINNAIDALAEVSSRSIDIVASHDGDFIRVDVIDSGPGFDPEVAGRIFDPMFTTKERGLGLGLCICRAILEAHGGSIALADAPAGGTLRMLIPHKAEAKA